MNVENVESQTHEEKSAPFVVYCSDDEHEPACSIVKTTNHYNMETDDSPSDNLSEWWPNVGRTLIDSLYHKDQEVRRNAVHVMMPITDRFPRTDVLQLTVTTPDIKRLHELYASKIVIEQKHIESSAEEWITKLNALCRSCRQEEERVRITKQELLKKAQRLVVTYGEDIKDIVLEQLMRVTKRLDSEKELRQQIARLQAHAQHEMKSHVNRAPIDAEIRKTESELQTRYPPEMFDSIRKTYMAHIRNIEHDVANRIQECCKCDWIAGLS